MSRRYAQPLVTECYSEIAIAAIAVLTKFKHTDAPAGKKKQHLQRDKDPTAFFLGYQCKTQSKNPASSS